MLPCKHNTTNNNILNTKERRSKELKFTQLAQEVVKKAINDLFEKGIYTYHTSGKSGIYKTKDGSNVERVVIANK